MKSYVFPGLDQVERSLQRTADHLGYVRVTRISALDDAGGNAERAVRLDGQGRFEWTLEAAQQMLPDVSATEDIWRAALLWIQKAIQAEQQHGEGRYRVRAYRPGAVSSQGNSSAEWSINIRCNVEDDDDEETVPPPTTAVDALQASIFSTLRSSVIETTGMIGMVTSHYDSVIAFYREENGRLHAMLVEKDRAIAEKDRAITSLTNKVIDRDRIELETQIGKLKEAQEELGAKAGRASMLDRLESIVSKVAGVSNLSDEAMEFLPLLAQDDVLLTFSNPRVKAILSNPAARKEMLETLTETLDGLADNMEQPSS